MYRRPFIFRRGFRRARRAFYLRRRRGCCCLPFLGLMLLAPLVLVALIRISS